MPDTTTAGLVAVRPTFLVDNQAEASLAEEVQHLEIREETQGLYRCEAAFANWGTRGGRTDFLYFDRTTLDFGKAFKVTRDASTLFDGRIMALEASFNEGAPPDLTVLAEDRFQDLRMTRRTRVFADASDADIFSQIAGDHSLTPDIHVSGPTHKCVAQLNLSDLAFLRERARALDAELWLEGTTLHVATNAVRRSTPLELNHGHELRAFTVIADLAHQRTGVFASGWDVAGKSAIQHDADDSTISGELNGDESGVSILAAKIGERKESLVHTVPGSTSEAQAIAESHFKHSARRFVVGRGVAETQAGLRVGAVVNLKNLGPLFSGNYYVVEVRHRFDSAKGLRTEFTAERAGLGRP